MHIRDSRDIKIGGISSSGAGPYPDNNNSIIESINNGSKNILMVHLVKKDDKNEGNVRIKSLTDRGNSILEKIFSSKAVIGKTLNELRDTKIEEL